MKVTGLRTRIIRVDASPRYNGSPIPANRPGHYEYPLLELHSDQAAVGYSTGYGPHGEGAASAAIIHDAFGQDILECNPRNVERTWQGIYRKNRHLYALSDAIVGIVDVALWDLAGKLAQQSISHMLGRGRDRVPCYQTSWLTQPNDQAIAEEAVQAVARGFHGYKLQLRDGPDADGPRFQAARAATPNFPLMQDAVAGYNFSEALAVGRLLSELDFTWFEEPIADRQISRLRTLTSAISVPTLAGETVSLAEIPELLKADAVTLVRGDVLLKAGVSGLHRAMRASELFGYNMEIHAANSPLLDVANLHLASAAHNTTWIEVHHPIFRFGLRNDALTPDANGFLTVPDAPGLGVELDWDWIDNHTVEIRDTGSVPG